MQLPLIEGGYLAPIQCRKVLYEGHPIQPGWNGEFQGRAQPMEVYAYVITYSDTAGSEKVLRGDVTLLR